MFRAFLTILFFFLLVSPAFSQLKTIQAIKISAAPHIDGWLDDPAWQTVPAATDFITNTPVYGNPATSRTEVKVIYDNTAIYFGAYIYDDPELVRKQFTPRDHEQLSDVDYFSVFIDTYKDRQNAYQFLVTSRDVQSDARVAPNIKSEIAYGDLSWDAVWDSKVTFRSDGWVVEMKIPYSSIRFSKKGAQDWGIQFMRFTRRLNETSFWNPVDPSVSGFVNQFGDLTSLENLVPPLRLSFSPYVSTGYRSTPYISEGTKNEWLKSGGMDVKYGISESFTLDATVIPDFGQVISDNVVNNITPFEIQFRENRPFFTEGTELFNKAGIFYSRRIGETPYLYNYVANGVRAGGALDNFTIIKNPEVTRLYNAIKFSGRTRNNLGIGIFNAITQPAKARLRRKINGTDSSFQTEPLSNYNIIVLDQALKNRSYFTFTNTNVLRSGNERDANVSAIDLALYDKQNRYGFFLRPRYSKIFGPSGYEGFANEIQFAKVSGNLQFSVSNELQTAKYDPNDLGFIFSPNKFNNLFNISYNIFKPTRCFLNQRYGLTIVHSYLFDQFEYHETDITGTVFWLFKNFWDVQVQIGTEPFWYNDFFELRTPANNLEVPRKKLKRPPSYFIFLDGSSDSRKRFFGSWSLGAAEGPLPNDPFYKIQFGARYRFSDRFSLDANFEKQYDNGQFGYGTSDVSTGASILARRKYTDVTSVVSGIYNFTSRMNITFRLRHFWNKLENTNLYNVKTDGYWVERTDLNPSDFNVNYNAFNLDVFYTWDFRLGSRIVLGWKNWLGRDFENYIDGFSYPSYITNGKQMLSNPHGNELTARFIYFLDYLQFKKRK